MHRFHMDRFNLKKLNKMEGKVKSLCLTKHYAMKAYWGVDV
jgi:hypothetical protein